MIAPYIPLFVVTLGEALLRQVLAEAEAAFCAGRGDDGRAALDRADLIRGGLAAWRRG